MFSTIILLATLGIGTSLHSFNDKWVIPRAGFEGKYYFSNTRGRFIDHTMTPQDKLTAYIRVHTTYTVLGFIDLNVAMQGWSAGYHGFVGGQGGYHTYRISSLIATGTGTVLAFCEGRKSSS